MMAAVRAASARAERDAGVAADSGGAGPTSSLDVDPHGDVAGNLQHLRIERRLAARSLTLYGGALAQLCQFAAAQSVVLREVTPSQIRLWAGALHRRGLAAASIAVVLSAWRGHYRWLARNGSVARNPVEGVRPPKAPQPLPKALSVDQAMAFVQPPADGSDGGDEVRGHPALAVRDQCIVELLYGCGLRVGEVVGLDLRAGAPDAGWIDAADATVHVMGKGSKRRSVPVGGPALAALAAWLGVRATLAGAEDTALFVSRQGSRLTSSQIRSRLARRTLASGLPLHVHPHMLRHSYASHLLQSSGDLRGVQELLGHASIVSTQVYTKLDFGHLSKVYDAAHPRARRRG